MKLALDTATFQAIHYTYHKHICGFHVGASASIHTDTNPSLAVDEVITSLRPWQTEYAGSKLRLRFGMGWTELSDANLPKWRNNTPRQHLRLYSRQIWRRILPDKLAKLFLITPVTVPRKRGGVTYLGG
ncbi:hypothetical protein OSTOST_22984 [Ostertagia ostertagi]